MNWKAIVGTASVVSLVLIVGCGGGRGGGLNASTTTGSAVNDQQATDDEAAGAAILNSIIRNQTPATQANLTEAATDFTNATTLVPTFAAASTGYAIAETALCVQQIFDLFGYTPTRGGSNPPDTALAKLASMAQIWNVAQVVKGPDPTMFTPISAFASMAPGATGTREYPSNPTYAQLRALLLSIQPNLDKALTTLEGDPVLEYQTMSLADPTKPSDPNATVVLGIAEAEALDSTIRSLDALIEIILSYNFDTQSMPLDQKFSDYFASQITSQTPITPDNYLPPNPFGTSESDAGTRMSTANSLLNGAVNIAQSSLNAIEARTQRNSTVGWLLTETSIGDVTKAQTQITFAINAMKGPQALNHVVWHTQTGAIGGNFTTNLNLPAWLNGNPPASLRPLCPTITPHTSTGIIGSTGQSGVTTYVYFYHDLGFYDLFSPDLPDGALLPTADGTIGELYVSLFDANWTVPWPQ